MAFDSITIMYILFFSLSSSIIGRVSPWAVIDGQIFYWWFIGVEGTIVYRIWDIGHWVSDI